MNTAVTGGSAGTIKLMVALALLLVLGAGLAWWFWPTPRSSPEDERIHRAEQACLSNSDNERGGKVTAESGAKDLGVRASAGVSSRDRQVRGPNERFAAADLLNESNAIRDCMERRLAAEKPVR